MFVSSGLAGYELVHFNRIISLAPESLAAAILSSNSPREAIPVEIINGLPVEATFLISGMWLFSKLAIL